MKKKLRKFFTLTHKANDGFTLVELIVVIAILAILSGVAVPAYSAYIEKSKRAADETLLGAVNTAFAAACAANGTDVYLVNSAYATLGADKTVDAVYRTAAGDEYNAAFDMFFEGNEDAAFQVIEDLYFDSTLHVFAENAAVTFSFGGSTITLSAEDIAKISGDNAFAHRGSAALLADIGILETYLAGGFIGDEILDEIGTSDEFYFAMGSYLGMNRADYADDHAYMVAIGDEVDRLKVDNPNIATNALIMYSASHAANASQTQIDKLFSGSITGNIAVTNGGVRDNEATMANAAIAYGMYTAYAQHKGLDTTQQGNDFVNVVGTTEFKDYIASDAGKADLDAYMAAMNMVSDNTGNPEVTGSILQNGITGNTELGNLMQDVMGN